MQPFGELESPGKEEEGAVLINRNTITHNYGLVALTCVFTYCALLAALYYNKEYSSSPVCELSFDVYSSWTRTVNILVSGAFISSVCIQLLRIFVLKLRSDHLAANVLSLLVNFLSGFSNILTWTTGIGGICRDIWGVTTPGITWVEWIVCVPLMGYIVVTVKLQSHLDNEDFVLIFGLFLCILMGGLLQTTNNILLYGFYLSISTVSFLVVLINIYWTRIELMKLIKKRASPSENANFGYLILNATRRFTISCVFSLIMLLFPIFYYARIFKLISSDTCFVCLMLSSCFSKIIFSVVMSDAHFEISSPIASLLADNIRINSSRRKFLRYIFHEMRVPLNSISLAVQLLLEELIGDKTLEETILIIHDSVRFMGESLNDVMAIQKIEEGALQLLRKSYFVWDICDLIAEQYELEILAKNLTVDIKFADDVPKYLMGDKFRISHVISNVFSNAVKFSNQNGIIEISASVTNEACDPSTGDSGDWYNTEEGVKEKKFLRFAVRDHGKGIAPEKVKGLFVPFTHLKDGEINRGQSRGIGLAICKEICHLNGGTIFCATDGDGKGSIFTIVLPFDVDDVELASQSFSRMDVDLSRNAYEVKNITHHGVLRMNERRINAKDCKKQGIPRTDSTTSSEKMSYSSEENKCIPTVSSEKPKFVAIAPKVTMLSPGFHILVVDDVLSNRKLLAALLKKRNAEVTMAVDGIDALEKVASHEDLNHYRMIFLDNTMPRMSGLQCTKELRERGFSSLIIGVTGNTMEEELVEFSNAGADLVLTKPMKLSQLDLLLRYSDKNGVGSQYIRGMNLFIGDEKVIICPRSSSNTISTVNMNLMASLKAMSTKGEE